MTSDAILRTADDDQHPDISTGDRPGKHADQRLACALELHRLFKKIH